MDKYGYIGIETLLNFCENSKDHSVTPNDFMRMKRVRMPERKKGKWMYGENEFGNDGYYCSVCGNFVPWKYGEYDIDFIQEFFFCNKCGADMRGDQNG